MTSLHNTRILDLTRLLPGNVCTMLQREIGYSDGEIRTLMNDGIIRLMP